MRSRPVSMLPVAGLLALFGTACGGGATAESTAPGGTTGGESATYVPGHEDRAFGVYLGRVDDAEGTARATIAARLAALGIEPGGEGELGCDRGAAEALSLPPDAIVASVYFRTEAEAQAFAARYGEGLLGMAEVTTMCRD